MAKGVKTGGRRTGTPNKTTASIRALIGDLTSGLYQTVLQDIEELEPNERVKVWLKLCEFCAPKPQSIAVDMSVEQRKTIEDKLLELSGNE